MGMFRKLKTNITVSWMYSSLLDVGKRYTTLTCYIKQIAQETKPFIQSVYESGVDVQVMIQAGELQTDVTAVAFKFPKVNFRTHVVIYRTSVEYARETLCYSITANLSFLRK